MNEHHQDSTTGGREIRVRVPDGVQIWRMFYGVAPVVALLMAGVALIVAVRAQRKAVTPTSLAAAVPDTSDADYERWKRRVEIEGVIAGYAPVVDLRGHDLQHVGDGFSVGHLELSSIPGAARLAGIVVNRESVGHESATFRLTVLGQNTEFTVMNIPPGGSARFTAVIPSINADSARTGEIRYVRSTVDYH